MRLREQLAIQPADEARAEPRATDTPAQASHAYQQMKSRVHQLLLGRLDLEAMEGMSPERLREELSVLVELCATLAVVAGHVVSDNMMNRFCAALCLS
ncbi:MAG: hypothetical protein H0W48_01645 [Methylibium sp.]|nr:hypothetical protein [Methylibium sp.]